MAAPRAAGRLNPSQTGLPDVGLARYHRAMKMSRLALIIACLLMLAACGNKGPLVLPQKPESVPVPDSSSPDEPVIVPPDSAQTVPPPPKDDGDGTPR